MERFHKILIKDFMTTDIIDIHMNDNFWDAYIKMKARAIHHLPVVNDNHHVMGVFTSTDLARGYAPRQTEDGDYYDKDDMCSMHINKFVTTDSIVLTEDDSLKNACEVMVRNKIGCIPIVSKEEKKLIGIISHVDILRKISTLFDD